MPNFHIHSQKAFARLRMTIYSSKPLFGQLAGEKICATATASSARSAGLEDLVSQQNRHTSCQTRRVTRYFGYHTSTTSVLKHPESESELHQLGSLGSQPTQMGCVGAGIATVRGQESTDSITFRSKKPAHARVDSYHVFTLGDRLM